MAEPMQEVEETKEEEVVEVDLVEDTNTGEVTTAPEPEEVTEVVEETKAEDTTEEIEEYSDSVQKRINKLTYKIREAERREKAAIEYAQSVQDQLNKTKTDLSQKDKNLYDEYSARVASELKVAEDAYRTAHDEGNTDIMLQAQKDIAKLSVELESLNRVKPSDDDKGEGAAEVVTNAPQPQTPQPEQVAQPDPKAQEWAKRNTWFGDDIAMTSSAFAFHQQLIESEGFDPASDEYYSELDKRMAEAFPTKVGNSNQNNNVKEVVAVPSRGVSRSTKKSRTVRLTPSQVAIAKRLGVSVEDYAKHVKT
jgi:hypothetical protein|tara:strand:+ start:26633 stop:27556 length:924 start_codon:yes stop_codon:yes gene_type:complete